MSRFKGRPRGVVLYEGESSINGEPIVAVATFNTMNNKTGNLIQTWIMHRDVHPIAAIHTGDDEAACGDCPLRGIIQKVSESSYKGSKGHQHTTINRFRGCYVAVHNAPRGIWLAYKDGLYPAFDESEHGRWFRNRGIRLGAYGEPVAVPLDVWKPLLKLSGRSAPGYTHQWRKPQFQEWSNYVMASTHSVAEVQEANALGWRSYRTLQSIDELQDNEIICPATAEGGYKHTCESCGACNGGSSQKRSIGTVVHGGNAVIGGALKVIKDAA
jgi:hypothetical protein